MTEIISFPKSEIERAETVISSAKSFDELEAGLQQLGRIKNSDNHIFSADELLDIVAGVRAGTLAPDFLTRTGGLRDKVLSLLSSTETSTENKETMPSPAQLIAEVTDFAQLEQVLLSKIETITGEQGQTYDARTIVQEINNIRFSGALLSSVTRQEGLRQKVTELYAQEAIAQARSSKDLEEVIINIYLSGGDIASSDGKPLDRNELIEKISLAVAGAIPVQLVTRTYGLRQKALELQIQAK